MMILIRTISLASLVLMTALILQAQTVRESSTTKAVGKLSGLILDPGEARVPKAKIIVEREGFQREIESGDDGSYEIELPVESYTVRVVRNDFYPTRKLGVQIRTDAVTILNMILNGILIREDLIPLPAEELRTETFILNTTIQLRKLLDKP